MQLATGIRKPLTLVAQCCIFCMAVGFWRLLRDDILISETLHDGDQIPSFEFVTKRQISFSLASMLGHKYALVFFSPACAQCQQVLPDLAHSFQRFSPELLRTVAISLGSGQETHELFSTFDFPMDFVVDRNHQLQKMFGVLRVPALFLVDERGRLHGSYLGKKSLPFYENVLRDFLGAQSPGY